MNKWWKIAVVSCLISSSVLSTCQSLQGYAAEKKAVEHTETKKETKTTENHPLYSKGNYPYADSLPEWDDDFWRYVNDSYKDGLRTWTRGTAYPYREQWQDHPKFSWDSVIGGQEAFIKAEKDLQTDDYTKDQGCRIVIMYKPRCPYTKRYLPQFKYLAEKAGAKVLLADVDTYRSGTLTPFMDPGETGLRLPAALYVTKDNKLKGVSGIDGAEGFADILEECGYNVEGDIPTDKVSSADQMRQDELIETNKERLAKGLLPLSTFDDVTKVADLRAKEIVERIEHTRPNGQSYATALQEAGVKGPNWYGENIAAGPGVADPWSVNDAWMNSPSHRQNILNQKYTHVGIGYYKNTGNTTQRFQDHWAQLFLGSCHIDKISLDTKGISVNKGVPLSDQNLTVTLHCATHGDTTMPLIDEMVTGYNPKEEGEQSVTVHYGDLSTRLLVNVGNVEPEPLKPEMINIDFDLAKNKKTKSNDIAEFEYTGQAQRPEISVTNPNGEYPLLEGYSYDVRYENNVEVGEAKVIITGKGNYTGKVEKTFKIVPRNLNGKVDVKGQQESYEYTGKAITPVMTVTTNDGQPLYQGKDFDVEYSNNVGELVKQAGQAVQVADTKGQIKITGKGNYTFSETKEFGFTMSTKQKAAETLAFVIGPAQNSGYNNVTEMLDTFKKWQNGEAAGAITDASQLKPAHKQRFKMYMEQTYEKVIEYSKSLGDMKEFDLSGSFDSKKEALAEAAKEPATKKGYQMMMTESLSPKTAQYVNEWINYVQKERNVSQFVEQPKVENTQVENVTVDGLESMIQSDDTNNQDKIQLEVTKPETTPTINSEKYDVVDAIPVKLDVKFGNTEKEITQPITITMDIPEEFDTENDLVALRETTQSRSNELEEIPVVVDEKNHTMSFTTTKTGNFVLTQKLPTYDVEQTLQPSNNPAISGVSFGETSNEGPAAVSDLKVSRNKDQKIQVSFKAPELNENWKLDGYILNYSQHEDMSDAQHVSLDKDATSAIVDHLPAGKYYFTVTTKASSAWTEGATRDSLTTMLDIPGEATEAFVPTYSIQKKHTGNGSLTISAEKDVKKGSEVTITATPEQGYITSNLVVTDANGNKVSVSQEDNHYKFTMPASDVTINAVFAKEEPAVKMQNITATKQDNGGIIFDDTQVISGKAIVGETVEFQAVADEGYQVDKVSVTTADGKEVTVDKADGDKYQFVMPDSEVTVTVTFTKKQMSQAIEKNVVAKKDVTLYSDLDLQKEKGKLSENTLLQARRVYTVGEKKIYSLYDVEKDKSMWKGYVDASEMEDLTSVDMKDINVTVTKENSYTLWKNFFYTEKKGSTKQGQVYKATRYYDVNGSRYYSLYKTNKDGKDEWQGYVNSNAVSELKATKVNKVYIVKKEYTLWNNFYWTKKRGTTKDYMNKAVNVKYQYTLGNGSRYYSVYDNKDHWLGYVNSNSMSPLSSVDMKDINVTVTKENSYTLWSDFLFKGKKGSTKQGQVYKATRYYDVNGSRYYSLYKTNKDGKDEWQGYVNSNAVSELKATKVGKTKTIVKEYTLWGNFYWTKKRGTTEKYMNQKVTVKYQYTLGNGSRYYSVYDNKDHWLGYVNANSCR